MPTIRIKPIVDTLDVVKKNGLYYRVIPKGDSFSTSRVKINSCKNVFEKSPKTVYSPATHLTGLYEDIVSFLETRNEHNDSSALEVLTNFKSDNNMITSKNYSNSKVEDHIAEVNRLNDSYMKDHPRQTHDDIPYNKVIEIYEIAKESRLKVVNGKNCKGESLRELISKLKASKDQVVRIYGFTSNGLVSGKPLKAVSKTSISQKAKALSDTEPLCYFVIPPQNSNRNFVKNFLTFYYTYIENVEDAADRAQVETDLLIPDKKVSTRTGRSVSMKVGTKKSSSPPSRKNSKSPQGAHKQVVSETVENEDPESDHQSDDEKESTPSSRSSSVASSVSSKTETRSPDRKNTDVSPRSTSPQSTSPKKVATRTIKKPNQNK